MKKHEIIKIDMELVKIIAKAREESEEYPEFWQDEAILLTSIAECLEQARKNLFDLYKRAE